MASRLQRLTKRLSRTTYESDMYDFGSHVAHAENPYNDEKDLLAIFENEPVAHGIIMTQNDAIFGEYSFEFVREKARKNEEAVKKIYLDWVRDPTIRFNQKIRTMGVKLLIDGLFYLEIDRDANTFYVLNKEDCTILWDEENIHIIGIKWDKISESSIYRSPKLDKDKNFIFIPIKNLIIASYFDMDTNLWQVSSLRSLVDSANILFHARNYNNDIFRSGGMPSFAYIFKGGINKDVFKKTVKEANTVKAGKNLFFKADIDIKQIGGFNKDMEYEKLIRSAYQDFMTAMRSSPLMTNLIDKAGGEDKNEFNAFSEKIHTLQSIMNDTVNEITWKLNVEPLDIKYTDEIAKVFKNRRMKVDTQLKKVLLLKANRASNPHKSVVFKLRKWVDLRLLSAIQKIWLDTGVMSPNEARAQIGLEPREGGDEFLTDKESASGIGAMGNTGGANPSSAVQSKTPTVAGAKPRVSASQKADGIDK